MHFKLITGNLDIPPGWPGGVFLFDRDALPFEDVKSALNPQKLFDFFVVYCFVACFFCFFAFIGETAIYL